MRNALPNGNRLLAVAAIAPALVCLACIAGSANAAEGSSPTPSLSSTDLILQIWEKAAGLPEWLLYPLCVAVFLLLLVSLTTFLSFLMYLFTPYLLLRLNERVSGVKVGPPDSWVYFRVPLKYLLGIGFFHYSDRLLDAYVRKHVRTARENFEDIETVKERRIYVDLPVELGGTKLDTFKPYNLRPLFNKSSCYLLITGEGGAGKTSLACRIARWAMSAEKDERVADDLMLPVILEHPLTAEGQQNVLHEAIRGRLKFMIGEKEPPSQELFKHLLIGKRVLVIIDRLSEMDDKTREKICPEIAGMSINALIVTSRIEESLGGIPRNVLRPSRIPDGGLYVFLDRYMKQAGVTYEW